MNARNGDRFTALIVASLNNDLHVAIRELMRHDAIDVHFTMKEVSPALFMARYYRHREVVCELPKVTLDGRPSSWRVNWDIYESFASGSSIQTWMSMQDMRTVSLVFGWRPAMTIRELLKHDELDVNTKHNDCDTSLLDANNLG